MLLVCRRHSVTWPDGLRWISVEPLGPGLAQLPGFQLGREVPDDHYRPIHRARHDPALLHRSRTARPRRLPGRVPRPDPRGLHLGPAPVHRLVSQPFPVAVLGAPAPTSKASPGNSKPGAGPAPRSPGAYLPSPGSTSTPSKRSSWITRPLRMSGGRASTMSLMRSRWTVTNSARCWWPPGSARLWSTRSSPCSP